MNTAKICESLRNRPDLFLRMTSLISLQVLIHILGHDFLNPSVLEREEKQKVALAVWANKKAQEHLGLLPRSEIRGSEPSVGKGHCPVWAVLIQQCPEPLSEYEGGVFQISCGRLTS